MSVFQTTLRLRNPLGRTDASRGAGDAGSTDDDTRRKRSQETFRGQLDSAPDAVVIVDDSGEIVLVNAQTENLFGYGREELVGQRVELLVPDRYRERHSRHRDGYTRHPHTRSMSAEPELYGRRKDGSEFPVEISLSPLQSEDGTLISSTICDITARKQVESELALATERAIEASRQKSEFVANMSHELRTPLNGVIGMTDLLRASALDPVQREYADALAACGEAVLALINDILDFSKIEAGRLELDATDFDLRSAVEEACLMLAAQAHAKDVEVDHWVDADVPVAVNGDRVRLRQILVNLLSNAVRCTASGEVVLRVSRRPDDMLSFAVSDTGAGIDQAQSAQLFQAFVQADLSTTRHYGGAGLGLAISRALVERMGGEIGAEPREDGGSVFWFTARLPEVASTPEAHRSHRELLGLRALIVDKRATNRVILEHYLGSWGLACESVDGPRAALGALDRASQEGAPFELALVDFKMPQMNGVELVNAIREHPRLRTMSIVMLSSAQIEPTLLAEANVSALLGKPARQSDLYDAVVRAAAGAPPARDLEPNAESAAAPDGPLVLIAEDNEINRAVAKALLAKRGFRTAVACDGAEAVRMARESAFAAIMMDCQMPGIDGYEATQRIRAAENGGHVPIIAMTAHSMRGDRERCLAAGMDDYIAMPVQNDDLDAALKRWLPEHEPGALAGAADGRSSAAGSQRKRNGDALLDLGTIQQLKESLTVEMRERLVRTFEESLSRCLVEITEAVAGEDRANVRRLAHLLKGSSATLGATRLSLTCLRLEQTSRDGDPPINEHQLADLQLAADKARAALRAELV